jgi:hypothetical protein
MTQTFAHNPKELQSFMEILKDSNNKFVENKSCLYGYDFQLDRPISRRTVLIKEIILPENNVSTLSNEENIEFKLHVTYDGEMLNQFKKKAFDVIQRNRRGTNRLVNGKSIPKHIR